MRLPVSDCSPDKANASNELVIRQMDAGGDEAEVVKICTEGQRFHIRLVDLRRGSTQVEDKRIFSGICLRTVIVPDFFVEIFLQRSDVVLLIHAADCGVVIFPIARAIAAGRLRRAGYKGQESG